MKLAHQKSRKILPKRYWPHLLHWIPKNLWYPKSIEGIVSKKIETYRTCFHNIRFSRYIENAFKRSVVVPKYRHKLAYCKNINVKVLINIPPTFAPNISVMMLK